MTHAEIIRSWPVTWQSLFWKLVDSEDYRPAEARAEVERLMEIEAKHIRGRAA